jgi:hypothetical protein
MLAVGELVEFGPDHQRDRLPDDRGREPEQRREPGIGVGGLGRHDRPGEQGGDGEIEDPDIEPRGAGEPLGEAAQPDFAQGMEQARGEEQRNGRNAGNEQEGDQHAGRLPKRVGPRWGCSRPNSHQCSFTEHVFSDFMGILDIPALRPKIERSSAAQTA